MGGWRAFYGVASFACVPIGAQSQLISGCERVVSIEISCNVTKTKTYLTLTPHSQTSYSDDDMRHGILYSTFRGCQVGKCT